MNCASCNASITETDRFCEECGAAIGPASSPVSGSVPAAVGGAPIGNPPPPPGSCAKCGASASAIDADGFCSQCGFRTEQTADPRLVISLTPTFAGVSDPGLKHRCND
jgi:PPM family protein phosphatase